jgi:hypothetical protein
MIVANTVCIIGSGLLVGLPDDNKVRSIRIDLELRELMGFHFPVGSSRRALALL